jgi:3-phosphoshikimate 1-carboxyvinyltransferase
MSLNSCAVKIFPGRVPDKITISTSKSYATRLLILASIVPDSFRIVRVPCSSDVINLINALKKIGLEITHEGDSVTVMNSFPDCEQDGNNSLVIETGDGGTTNRFLAALLARGEREYHLVPSGKISTRPSNELMDTLRSLSVQVEYGTPEDAFWLKIKGPIAIADRSSIEIASNRSSQFASALTLTLVDYPSLEIIPKNLAGSVPYYELTQRLVRQVRDTKQDRFSVPYDMSTLSYPLALGVICGTLRIEGLLELDPFQPDHILVEIITKMGGKTEFTTKGLVVYKSQLQGITLDCSNFPDLVPTLAFICSYSDGRSTLCGLEALQYKESDRISEITKSLDLFCISYCFDSDLQQLVIDGFSDEKPASSVEVLDLDDHRIIMMNYLFMLQNSGGVLGNIDHLKKSCPEFISLISQ